MKFPKQIKTYCQKCKKHTLHRLKQVKVKARPKTKKGALRRGTRHIFQIFKGYGGMARPKVGEKYKTSSHPVILFTCTKCNRSVPKKYGRLKKVTQV